jgi:allantoicase
MLNPEPAVFMPGKYDANGKWMDGWEARRKRGPGHDWCVVRWRGRAASTASTSTPATSPATSRRPRRWRPACRNGRSGRHDWFPLLPSGQPARQQSPLFRDRQRRRASLHLRVNLYPDGGLARLRVYGTPEFDAAPDADGLIDLVRR